MLPMLVGVAVGTLAAFSSEHNVSVHEHLIDSPVAEVQWVGKDKRTVYVRSARNIVYRSADVGRTWEQQNGRMEGSAMEEDGKSGIQSLHVSPVDASKIFFRGVGSRHWITTDRGQHYHAVEASFPIKEVKMHPTESEWMLASHLSAGCRSASQRTNCSMEVYVTTDLGRSWRLVSPYVAQFDWPPSHDGVIKRGYSRHTLFLVAYEQHHGNQPFGVWSSLANFLRSDDLGKTHVLLARRGNRFLFLDHFLFVAVVNAHHDNQVNMYVASDSGRVFKKARLPFQLTEHSYTILDTSEGAVFLHVNHGDYHTGYGNIYLSDAEGLRFSLSLRNNKRDDQGRCDFEKVQGIEGVYISNEQMNADEGAPEKPLLRTKISFDKGGSWAPLAAPVRTDKGRDFACRPQDDRSCSLHLHGVTDTWGPFYSSKGAIGLVMATGNVGHHLSDKEDEVHTFFSRDAGMTWSMVREGSHIYEYGDHGAVIVLANDRRATTEVLFSWDEAMSWSELRFSDEPTEIENIVIEPRSTSQVFLMYGSRGERGVLIQLDFTQLHEPRCQGLDKAGEPHSDYELWSPTDGRSGVKCILGHQVRYTRRRRASKCFNGEEYERVEFRKNCPCAEQDYECDYGYERSSDNGPCVAVMAVSTAPPAHCVGEYTVSNGYRLIPGDTCDASGGVDHTHTRYPCPGRFGGAAAEVSSSGWLVLLLLACLLGVLAFSTLSHRSERFRELLRLKRWPRFMPDVRYGGLGAAPDSAIDDELDLGDEDEAEELRDGDMYDHEVRIGSPAPPVHLIGEEYTSPLAAGAPAKKQS